MKYYCIMNEKLVGTVEYINGKYVYSTDIARQYVEARLGNKKPSAAALKSLLKNASYARLVPVPKNS